LRVEEGKVAGLATPTLTKLGRKYHHDFMYAKKVIIANICTLSSMALPMLAGRWVVGVMGPAISKDSKNVGVSLFILYPCIDPCFVTLQVKFQSSLMQQESNPRHVWLTRERAEQIRHKLEGVMYSYVLEDSIKGHGNEPNFPSFLHKSLWPRSLTPHFEPFRFWLRIRGDIRIRKTTPHIGESGSRQDCLEYTFFSKL
jgi:hypothetical protein